MTEDPAVLLAGLRELAAAASSDEEVRALTSRIASITRAYRIRHGIGLPSDPAVQASALDPGYRSREHIAYLSSRVVEAVRAVERGSNRRLAVSMPPRAGKSTLLSLHTPIWLLRRHPEWSIVTASYDSTLSAAWARNTRR